MLDWLSKEFLLAVAVSLMIAVIVLSLFGPPHYIYAPGSEATDQQSQTNPLTPDETATFEIRCDPNCSGRNGGDIRKGSAAARIIDKISNDPLAAGVLIANFLLVLTVVSQIREARASSEATLRAYLVVKVGTQFRQGGVRGLRFEFRPGLLNTGQTPAYEMRTIARVAFLSPAEAAAFNFNLPDPTGDPTAASAVTLGPEQDRFVQAILDRRLSKAELREYQRMQKFLYVYGTTYYRDAFRKARYTNFCYSVSWWNKRALPLWQTVFRHSDSN
jgi:hypothetical protein